jgi:hypothetical protein
MPKQFRLKHLKVQNFKVLDSFEIEFPLPRMRNDPDVFVFGSKNGFGKTSLLESCALLLLSGMSGKEIFEFRRHPEMPINLTDLLVRAGTKKARIEGDLVFDELSAGIEVSFDRSGESSVRGNTELLHQFYKTARIPPSEFMEQFLFSLIGLDDDPLILPGLMYFHSYRKVQEGNPELGMMVSGERPYRRTPYAYRRKLGPPVSMFKLEVLRSMMGKADLFEIVGDQQSQGVLNQLNVLVRHYAGGTIEKLRPSPDNTLDFRITPTGDGPSFAFDGLSSGQKEIISTLFLIWFYSKNQPSIVLIDEPDLHLNAEWQRDFVYQLHKLAPWNQYIIATHSEDVFGSVPQERRFLLIAGKDAKA